MVFAATCVVGGVTGGVAGLGVGGVFLCASRAWVCVSCCRGSVMSNNYIPSILSYTEQNLTKWGRSFLEAHFFFLTLLFITEMVSLSVITDSKNILLLSLLLNLVDSLVSYFGI